MTSPSSSGAAATARSTMGTGPTRSTSTFEVVWFPKIPAKITRNISGNRMVNASAPLSRTKPRSIARDRLRKLAYVLMPGTPVR
nr:hypothetical protein [Actinomadura sp. CNU-125]